MFYWWVIKSSNRSQAPESIRLSAYRYSLTFTQRKWCMFVSSVLKMDHLTWLCCLSNEASLISQTFFDCTTTVILHTDTHLSTSPYIKGSEESCLGNQRDGKSNRQKTHWKHRIIKNQPPKNSLQVTAKSRKVTLRLCNIFLRTKKGPKGPLNTTRRTFLCITNLWIRKQNSD